jgi:transposase
VGGNTWLDGLALGQP